MTCRVRNAMRRLVGYQPKRRLRGGEERAERSVAGKKFRSSLLRRNNTRTSRGDRSGRVPGCADGCERAASAGALLSQARLLKCRPFEGLSVRFGGEVEAGNGRGGRGLRTRRDDLGRGQGEEPGRGQVVRRSVKAMRYGRRWCSESTRLAGRGWRGWEGG